MTLRGGYDIVLAGKPDKAVMTMPDPEKLILPLKSRRFSFSDVVVKDGDEVSLGDVLARDPDNFAVPLLAPRGGKVRYKDGSEFITLRDLTSTESKEPWDEDMPHIVQEMGASGIKRYKLLSLGAWQYLEEAHTGELPDPLGTPSAVIVSTLSLEPFMARGDIQIRSKMLNFTRGLEQLQSLLEYQPIYLVMPDIRSEFATQVRQHLRGYAWVKLVEVPLKYPFDNFAILARHLRLKADAGPVWALRSEGVLAIDQALTAGKNCVSRLISVGGPAISRPCHVEILPGYPLGDLAAYFQVTVGTRLLDGGALTGRAIDFSKARGLECECRGLTALTEQTEREFLGFMRLGFDRKCYAGCFMSSLRGKFRERLTTGTRGELRPCIACGFCERVCPAAILPYLIHKHLYADQIEDVERVRVDLCVQCGLCSYVCPSKIDLMQQFVEAKVLIAEEKAEAAAAAAKAAAEEEAAKAAAAAAQES